MLLVCGAAVRGAPFAAQRLHPKFQRMLWTNELH